MANRASSRGLGSQFGAAKDMLGERLYVLIQCEGQVELAGKITGMLLDCLELRELEEIVVDKQALRQWIQKALEALEGHQLEKTQDQGQYLGEKLHCLIQGYLPVIQGEGQFELASKITGMLLEALQPLQLEAIIFNKQALCHIIQQALVALCDAEEWRSRRGLRPRL